MENLNNSTTAIAIQDQSTQVLATNYIQAREGLGITSINPIAKLYEVGFKADHIDMILDAVDYYSPSQNNKINHLLTAIRDTHSDSELETIASNYEKFKDFTYHVARVEVLRDEIGSMWDFKLPYHKCFQFTKDISVSEFENILEMTDSKTRPYLAQIIEETQKTGITPELYIENNFNPRFYKD